LKLVHKILSFSIVGLIMTVLSLIMSVSLLKLYKTPLVGTYLFVYSTTLVISYLLNSKLTFHSSLTMQKGTIYFIIYLFSMCFGTLMYVIIPNIIILPNWYYPFIVLPFTATLNYYLSNKYLRPFKNNV